MNEHFSFLKRFLSLVNELRTSPSHKLIGLKRVLRFWRWLILAASISLLCIAPGFGQERLILDTADVTAAASASRGTTITINSDKELSFPPNSKIRLTLSKNNRDARTVDRVQGDIAQSVFKFTLPDNLELGQYQARLAIAPMGNANLANSYDISIPGSNNNKLTINSDSGILSPRIQSVVPRVIFPLSAETSVTMTDTVDTIPNIPTKYSFTVIGEEFSINPTDNRLILYSRDNNRSYNQVFEPSICWNAQNPTKCLVGMPSNPLNAIGEVVSNRELKFKILPIDLTGELGIAIRVGDNTSNIYPITLSVVKRYSPLAISVAISGVIAGLIAILSVLKNGLGSTIKAIWDGTANPFHSLVLDKDTNTYSLQRLQFLLWTGVAILSYLFLFVSKSFAQGKLEFIDIPDGLPSIVLVSAATSFFAIGIDSTKGSKGAGPVDPSCSDFISAGGSILPERLQFFAWTIIGAFVYLIIVLFQNPGVITDLPVVPSGFLQLSGISSLGYLGGKLARKPGPVIKTIDAVSHDGDFLILKLRGSNLSVTVHGA